MLKIQMTTGARRNQKPLLRVFRAALPTSTTFFRSSSARRKSGARCGGATVHSTVIANSDDAQQELTNLDRTCESHLRLAAWQAYRHLQRHQ